MELDKAKLNELLGKVVAEMGAAADGPLILLGDKLGLFKSLAAKVLSPRISESMRSFISTK